MSPNSYRWIWNNANTTTVIQKRLPNREETKYLLKKNSGVSTVCLSICKETGRSVSTILPPAIKWTYHAPQDHYDAYAAGNYWHLHQIAATSHFLLAFLPARVCFCEMIEFHCRAFWENKARRGGFLRNFTIMKVISKCISMNSFKARRSYWAWKYTKK